MTTPQYAAGWFPDPTMRHRLRWSDGATWTDWVADGTTAIEEREFDARWARVRPPRPSHTLRTTLLAVGAGVTLLVAVLLAFGAMIDHEASTELTALRTELRTIEVPASVVRTHRADTEMPPNFAASAGWIERTYRPAAGVSAEQATADFVASLESQGYRLDAIEYRSGGRTHRSWGADCFATKSCSLDLDVEGNRITLTLEG